jgi:hypothetical protein
MKATASTNRYCVVVQRVDVNVVPTIRVVISEPIDLLGYRLSSIQVFPNSVAHHRADRVENQTNKHE